MCDVVDIKHRLSLSLRTLVLVLLGWENSLDNVQPSFTGFLYLLSLIWFSRRFCNNVADVLLARRSFGALLGGLKSFNCITTWCCYQHHQQLRQFFCSYLLGVIFEVLNGFPFAPPSCDSWVTSFFFGSVFSFAYCVKYSGSLRIIAVSSHVAFFCIFSFFICFLSQGLLFPFPSYSACSFCLGSCVLSRIFCLLCLVLDIFLNNIILFVNILLEYSCVLH